MKITWGHAITISFILFAVYILHFVYRSFMMDIDLVAEDYYAQEVAFQDRIEAVSNADQYAEQIDVSVGENGVLLSFPKQILAKVGEGQVQFFRPSTKDLDRSFPLQLDDKGQMFFPGQLLASGRYSLQVSWMMNEEAFYIAKDIVF